MRMPNGYGTINKLSGKRRNPYMARITVGWKDCKQERKILGYYPTRSAAMDALIAYHANPYDLSQHALTFAEVYEKWSDEKFKKYANPSSTYVYKSIYTRVEPLYNIPFKDIKLMHLEKALNESTLAPTMKAQARTLFKMLFNYAIKYEICDKNYAELLSVETEETKHHDAMTIAQINIIKNSNHFLRDFIIANVYTGFRPSELIKIKIKNVDIENGVIVGGMKTKAGKDRQVPIHPDIMPIIKKKYDDAVARGYECLFARKSGNAYNYSDYREEFSDYLKSCDITNITPHSCRSTFITIAKRCKFDEYILKRIVGHAIDDLTEETYTTRDIEQLKAEMKKFKIQ